MTWIIGGSINLDIKDGGVGLAYNIDDQTVYEHVELTTVPNNYGGSRSFFHCPACGRRVRFLYRPWDQDRFRCRSCWRLNYPSQQEAPGEVGPYRKAIVLLIDRFKLPPLQIPKPEKFYDFVPPRPKGMHRSTYRELCQQLELLQGEYERHRYIRTHKIGRRIFRNEFV